MPHDEPGTHLPVNSIPDIPLLQGRRSRKMYQESWIYFHMYVIMRALLSHNRIWTQSQLSVKRKLNLQVCLQ